MSYRTQEIIRMIIPGLYLIAMLLILLLIGGGWSEIQKNDMDTVIDVLKGASNVVVLLLPFVGFVVGYMIECLMSFGERLLYTIGVRRPSKVVLMGSKLYALSNLDDIKKNLRLKKITNAETSKALKQAKQAIDLQKVEIFHDTSVMGRNIMGSQVVLAVFASINRGLLSWESFAMLVMLLVLGIYWYHRNCIYVQYVFSEYGRMITVQESKKVNPRTQE